MLPWQKQNYHMYKIFRLANSARCQHCVRWKQYKSQSYSCNLLQSHFLSWSSQKINCNNATDVSACCNNSRKVERILTKLYIEKLTHINFFRLVNNYVTLHEDLHADLRSTLSRLAKYRGRVINTPDSYSGGLGFKSRLRTSAILIEHCRGFLSPSIKNRNCTLKLGHDRVLPNPIQFIVIYLSPYHGRCIVQLLKKLRKIN
jgi:hypothetical protein